MFSGRVSGKNFLNFFLVFVVVTKPLLIFALALRKTAETLAEKRRGGRKKLVPERREKYKVEPGAILGKRRPRSGSQKGFGKSSLNE